ncbi:hypothetical protein [Evansella tamaricis]|uniref:Uncharacterized protein n=1 Tax=Evansella tamaricis TaxID=2069301 RepID=A0ABS6JHN9_9BACI|nr:hypothetical protein [Evansella tamaricis]MBU9713194.1 hypothetical protein [Evansella tamaricis]
MNRNVGSFYRYIGIVVIIVGLIVGVYLFTMLQDTEVGEWNLQISLLWVYVSILGGILVLGIATILKQSGESHRNAESNPNRFSKKQPKKGSSLKKHKEGPFQQSMAPSTSIRMEEQKTEVEKELTHSSTEEKSFHSSVHMTRKERQLVEKKGRQKKKDRRKKRQHVPETKVSDLYNELIQVDMDMEEGSSTTSFSFQEPTPDTFPKSQVESQANAKQTINSVLKQPEKSVEGIKKTNGTAVQQQGSNSNLNQSSSETVMMDEKTEVPFDLYMTLSRYSQKTYKRKPQGIRASNIENHYFIIIKPKKIKLVKLSENAITEVK